MASVYDRERFRWEARDRSTGILYTEDERGLGSFAQLDPYRLDELSIYTIEDRTEVGIHLAIPEGCKAVFARRRVLTTGGDGGPVRRASRYQPGWTIIGLIGPDGTELYHFFNNVTDESISSTDFNAV